MIAIIIHIHTITRRRIGTRDLKYEGERNLGLDSTLER